MGEALQANGEQTFSRPGRCLARDVVRVERHACRGVTVTVLQTCRGVTLCPGRQKRGSAEGCTGATRNRITSVSGNGKGRIKQQPIQSTGGLVGVSERTIDIYVSKEPPEKKTVFLTPCQY